MATEQQRRNYSADPGLSDRVFTLLEVVFPGIGKLRSTAAQLGSLWDHCSIPFVVEREERTLSHVGLLDLTYVINGEQRQLGGVHGVATLASERRRGHFGGLMAELLDYCEGRFETLELTTGNPEYYERYGFRVIPEHRFRLAATATGGQDGFQTFDINRPGDLEQLDRLLDQRVPISIRVGIIAERDVFKFSWGNEGVYYSARLDCFAVMELEGTELMLYDVVAIELPSLEALLAELTWEIETVVFHFSPDRFTDSAVAEPYRYDGDYFMVRGPFAAEGTKFMVPATARH